MKKLKFKNDKISFKKFYQIIFEDKNTKQKYGMISIPEIWNRRKIVFNGKEILSYYKGKLLKNKPKGLGTEIILEWGNYLEDVVHYYKGNWKNGKKDGKGYWSNHHPLVGRTWSLNAGNPYYFVGLDFQDDAYYYDGYWKNNMKHGKGYIENEEGVFKGEFKNDKPHEKGKLIYWDGSVYVGEWKDGNKHGQGTMTHSDGKIEKGIWENGKLIKNEESN